MKISFCDFSIKTNFQKYKTNIQNLSIDHEMFFLHVIFLNERNKTINFIIWITK